MTTYASNQPNTGDRPPQIRFDAISEAFNLLRANLGTWVLITLVYFAVVFALEFVIGLVMGVAGMGSAAMMGGMRGRGGSDAPPPNLPVILFGQSLSSIVLVMFSAFFTGGFFRAAMKQVRGETVSVGDLFTCGDVLGALVGGMLLYGLSVEVGVLFCIVPGIFLTGALMFTLPLIVDKRMGAIDALKLSFETLKGQAWAAFGVYFVAGLLASLGGLACGIGLLATMPLPFLTIAIMYRDFFGGGTAYSPQIEMPMPPPSSATSRLDA